MPRGCAGSEAVQRSFAEPGSPISPEIAIRNNLVWSFESARTSTGPPVTFNGGKTIRSRSAGTSIDTGLTMVVDIAFTARPSRQTIQRTISLKKGDLRQGTATSEAFGPAV